MAFSIRSLNSAEDLPALLKIEQACFASPLSEAQLSKQVAHARTITLGLFAPELVGFAIYTVVLDEAELLQIAVLPSEQGQGYANALLRRSVEVLQEKRVERIMLEVRGSNAAARALYSRCGFMIDGRRKGYYPALDSEGGREDAILMSYAVSAGAVGGE